MNFIPQWLRGWFGSRNLFNGLRNYWLPGQVGEVWVNTLKPKEIYYSIPQAHSVINKDANMFSNMKLKLINIKSGDEIEDKELHALLQNPNPLQSQNEWLFNYCSQLDVFGNQFIRKNVVSKLSKYPRTLFNISPEYMRPVLSGKVWEQVDLNEIITSFKYVENGFNRDFTTEEIMFSKIADISNPIIGTSPLVALKYPLSNTDAAYKYFNRISTKTGGIGAWGLEPSKDAFGNTPPDDKEIQRLQDAMSKYGIEENQYSAIISPVAMKWNPSSYPTAQLQLQEQIDANMIAIADAFGHNINIYGNKSATFENVKQGLLQTYNDAIIPKADLFTQQLSAFLKVPEGTRIIATYDHLTLFKEDKRQGIEGLKSMVDMLKESVESGFITQQQAQTILQTELGI